ncbi:hypothetical protein DPMN_063932 [Dreissena polymorpha]|uniref:Uncharacterized protein n=1 Tax=Dreissena polymorpha TaxID=45954 RepID=A0A9D4CCQ8_DREPO|nr:hypothetical protein DPMN_063932 [Dreissena polymorpha]
MVLFQFLSIVCTVRSLRANLLQPTGNQIVVDNELMVKLQERMEYKDEVINELRQIQQSQEATISKLRKDVDQMTFENEQLKESFLKCEFAMKSLGSIVENAEYKNKKEETNVRDYDNVNTFDEKMDSTNVPIDRDNPTKQLPTISHRNIYFF